jgi:hypothetical protein
VLLLFRSSVQIITFFVFRYWDWVFIATDLNDPFVLDAVMKMREVSPFGIPSLIIFAATNPFANETH